MSTVMVSQKIEGGMERVVPFLRHFVGFVQKPLDAIFDPCIIAPSRVCRSL